MGEKHVDLGAGVIHRTPDLEYTNIAQRDADTVYSSNPANLFKTVWVASLQELQLLISNAPTWVSTMANPTPPLSSVLAAGNETSGTDLIISATDNLFVGGGMNVGGTATPDLCSSIDLTATDKALVLNRVGNTEEAALGLIGPEAMFIYNPDLMGLRIFTGNQWESVLVGVPGIDDVLAVNQSINGVTRSIALINNGDFVYAADYSNQFTEQSLIDKNYSDFHSYLAQNVQNTGVISGGMVTQTSATTLSISAGTGFITDFADPTNPKTMRVDIAEDLNFTPANLSLDGVYIFRYDDNGNRTETLLTSISDQDRRDRLLPGGYIAVAGVIVEVIPETLNIGYDGMESFKDFFTSIIGPSNAEGNVIFPNISGNLSIDNTGGRLFVLAANFRIEPENPDRPLVSPIASFPFIKVFRAAPPGQDIIPVPPPASSIDPDNYDDGSGVLASMPPNDWQVQLIYCKGGLNPLTSLDGSYFVAYGQEVFNTFAGAQAALLSGTLEYEEFPELQFLVQRSWLIVKTGATDLTDTNEAVFFNAGKSRSGGVATSGGVAGINLPGGSSNNIQFNDMGTFGGTNDLTWDGSELFVNGLINGGVLLGDGNRVFQFSGAPYTGVGNLSTTIFGNGALANQTGGDECSAFGKNALNSNITASDCSAFGAGALQNNLTSFNTAVGTRALQVLSSGTLNTAMGRFVGISVTTGNRLTLLGQQAGQGLVTANGGIYLGNSTTAPAATTNEFLNIGNILFGDLVNNKIVIGGGVAFPTGDYSLRLAAVSQAFGLNSMDTTQEGAMTLADGMVWYNSTLNKYRGRENGITVTFTTV